MSEWKKYKRKGLAEMRDHIPGESMQGISVSPEDELEIQKADKLGIPSGGKVARNPKNHKDQWYVNSKYFQDNFEAAE